MSTETASLVPSYVVFQVGTRRVALARDAVAELIASPILFTFPHTSPLITGVVLRRGRIVPVLDLAPGLLGAASPPARLFLVVERQTLTFSERCAIPVQGECELVAGVMLPGEPGDRYVSGRLELNEEKIDVLDLEKTIAAGVKHVEDSMVPAEVLQ
jgi:hypothetical protein